MFLQQHLQFVKLLCPIAFGSFVCITFGIMLGWPSANFPQLLDNRTAEIPITFDQSATIAGLLMYGNSVGVLIGSTRFLDAKVAVCSCLLLQTAGWLVMVYATNVASIMISRLLVGLGNGYGTTQLKYYIRGACDAEIARFLCNYLSATVFLGVCLANVLGLFLRFRQLSPYVVAVPAVALVVFLLAPRHVDKASAKSADVKTVSTIEVGKRADGDNQTNNPAEHKFVEIFTNRTIRNNTFLIFVLVVVQQYCGGASNIVYSQIIFASSGIRFPELFPIIYAAGVLLFAVVATTVMYRYAIKHLLIAACALVTLINLALAVYFYYRAQLLAISEHFALLPLFLLLLYTAAHNLGIASVPVVLLNTRIPQFAHEHVYKIYVVTFSLGAVTSTKLFQYMFTYYDMSMAYAVLSVAALFGLLIAVVFVTHKKKTILISG